MPAKLGMLWPWALIATVACAALAGFSRADGPTAAPAPTVNEVVALVPTEYRHRLVQKLSMAENNRDELLRTILNAKPDQRDGLGFLISNMPEGDLTSLKADFLARDVALAYQARQDHPWGATIPDDIFLDSVLPYANLNERRDDWRADFVAKFGPLVKDCKTATEAAQVLNRSVFDILKVKYHATKRRKPDQSPYESTAIGYASCTGLSIILADACRAVGVPARVVGAARWSDDSGNHTWVEIWDGQWWFLGAAEPGALNDTWFGALAAKAEPERPEYRIYAASFRETSDHFPLIWDLNRTDVGGVDVSRYYIKRKRLSINVLGEDGRPADALVSILQDSRTIGRKPGSAPSFEVGTNSEYLIRATAAGDLSAEQSLHFPADSDSAIELKLTKANKAEPAPAAPHAGAPADPADSAPIAALKSWLATPTAQRPDLAAQPFSHADLTKSDAAQAQKLLWDDHVAEVRATRESDWKNDRVVAAGKTMKFLRKNFGDKPKDGWNLFISMHGGGNAPPSVNDSQWQNQIKLYQPANSLYIAPRAPTDTWNLWHESHIDALFDQIIQDAIVLEGVNPDRVYIMGYSAGGDGVYQLAPRMADRWAAASMMAGHPNDASPLGLRNIGFTIHVGANDAGYDRNKVAAKWGELLDDLQKSDPTGYVHEVKLHEGRAHWMNLEDKVAVDWMLKFTRNPLPEKIVWKQSTVTHDRFYWLAMPPGQAKAAQEVVATRSGQTVDIQKAENVDSLIVLLGDDMLDMDTPVRITMGGKELFAGKVRRTIATIRDTIAQRGDPRSIFSGSVTVQTTPPK